MYNSNIIINVLPFLASVLGFFWSVYLFKNFFKYRWLIIALQLVLAYSLLDIFLSAWIKSDPLIVGLDEFMAIPLIYFTYKGFKKSLVFEFILGFVLFLVLDNLKPWLITTAEDLPGVLGVLADDVSAALLAGLILFLVHLGLRFLKSVYLKKR
ncbi:MAG: phosphatidylglycerophosphatase A [Candidatus Pacebacteria bacterium]|nr:phosphatidylglycerophosphatase A [Candidatus Paceibacterota bacterium]